MKPASSGRMPVAPFKVALLNLKVGDSGTDAACDDDLSCARSRGIDVLYDDREERPGAKFATADLVGMPWQVIVGPKGLADGKVELKRRATGERHARLRGRCRCVAGSLSRMASANDRASRLAHGNPALLGIRVDGGVALP